LEQKNSKIMTTTIALLLWSLFCCSLFFCGDNCCFLFSFFFPRELKRVVQRPKIHHCTALLPLSPSLPVRHSSTGTVAYSTLQMISLRTQDNKPPQESRQLRKISFRTRPVVDVQCNRRYEGTLV
jgi:hypothetical protein